MTRAGRLTLPAARRAGRVAPPAARRAGRLAPPAARRAGRLASPAARGAGRLAPPAAARRAAALRAAAPFVAAVAADRLLGDPRQFHPVAGFGTAAGALERPLWRPSRAAGALHLALLVVPLVLAARAAERAVARRAAALVVLRAAALWVALGGRSLAREAAAVEALVDAGDLPAARRRVRSLVGRDPEALDAAGLRRAVLESLGENGVDAVVAAHLWAAAGGSAGVLAHRAVNTLDAMVGHRSDRYARFGTPAARADDVLGWPAARLGAALTVALAPAVGGSPRAAARAWRRDAPAHPSPNAGPAEAAFAGALGLRLGGSLAYGGRVEHRPVLHPAGRDPVRGDVARAIRLATLVGHASALLAAAAAALRPRTVRRPLAAASGPLAKPRTRAVAPRPSAACRPAGALA